MKNINLRVRKDNKIILSCRRGTSIEEIEKIILNNKDFLIDAQKRISKKNQMVKEYKNKTNGKIKYLSKFYDIKRDNLLDNKDYMINKDKNAIIFNKNLNKSNEKLKELFFNNQADLIFNQILDKVYENILVLNIEYPKLEHKYYKSRWGCCYPNKGKIILNRHLIKTEIDLIEYVILHELIHFKYIYHDKNFYKTMNIFMNDYKERRDRLNKDYILDIY